MRDMRQILRKQSTLRSSFSMFGEEVRANPKKPAGMNLMM